MTQRPVCCVQVNRLAAQQAQSEHSQHTLAMPYQAGFEQRWPDMLGSVPSWEGLPKVCLKNGRTCPIIATSSRITEGISDVDGCLGNIACLSLSPSIA